MWWLVVGLLWMPLVKAALFATDDNLVVQCQDKAVVVYDWAEGLQKRWQRSSEGSIACGLLNGVQQVYPFALSTLEWVSFQKQWQGMPSSLYILTKDSLSLLTLNHLETMVLWENSQQAESLSSPVLKIVDAFLEGAWSRLLLVGQGTHLMVWEISVQGDIRLRWQQNLEGPIKSISGGRIEGGLWRLMVLSQSANKKYLILGAYDLGYGLQKNEWIFKFGDVSQLYLIDSDGGGDISHAFVFASQQKVGLVTFLHYDRRDLSFEMPHDWRSLQIRRVQQDYHLQVNGGKGKKTFVLGENFNFLYLFDATFDETGDCSLYLQGRQLLRSWCLTEEEGNAVQAKVLVESSDDFGLTTYYLK